MNVKEIVKAHLAENGYDGLCDPTCGCSIKTLFPCGGDEDCEPGHMHRNGGFYTERERIAIEHFDGGGGI